MDASDRAAERLVRLSGVGKRYNRTPAPDLLGVPCDTERVMRTGRFVASVGAVVLGLLALGMYGLLLSVVAPGGGVVLALACGILGCAVFGVVTAAFYTWTVDGQFVLSRSRGR